MGKVLYFRAELAGSGRLNGVPEGKGRELKDGLRVFTLASGDLLFTEVSQTGRGRDSG